MMQSTISGNRLYNQLKLSSLLNLSSLSRDAFIRVIAAALGSDIFSVGYF